MCNDEKTSVVERNMLGFFNHCQVVDMSVANKLVNMKFFLKRHPNFPKYTWVIFSHICTLCYKVLMNVLTYTHAIREFLTKIQKPNSSWVEKRQKWHVFFLDMAFLKFEFHSTIKWFKSSARHALPYLFQKLNRSIFDLLIKIFSRNFFGNKSIHL